MGEVYDFETKARLSASTESGVELERAINVFDQFLSYCESATIPDLEMEIDPTFARVLRSDEKWKQVIVDFMKKKSDVSELLSLKHAKYHTRPDIPELSTIKRFLRAINRDLNVFAIKGNDKKMALEEIRKFVQDGRVIQATPDQNENAR